MENQDKKRSLIIDAASKRFAHFGMAKTTMTEIAKDLSLSKALLYYYFPDKVSLFAAVLEDIAHKTHDKITKSVKEINTTEDAILRIIDMRLAFIMKYYNLFDHNINITGDIPSDINDVIERIRDLEIVLITTIFEKGVQSKELEIDDIACAANIFVNSMIGMRFCVLSEKKGLFLPTKEEFDKISTMQKTLARIFIKGLSK